MLRYWDMIQYMQMNMVQAESQPWGKEARDDEAKKLRTAYYKKEKEVNSQLNRKQNKILDMK